MAFVCSSLIKFSIRVLELFFLLCLIQLGVGIVTGSEDARSPDFISVMRIVLANPGFIIVMLLYILHFLQRMIVRMDDIDTK